MKQSKPNILIVHTDEHNLRTLGCYRDTLPPGQDLIWGPDSVETPHIDELARTGALCTNFYATTPVCTPSRGSMMSGQYPQSHGAYRNNIALNHETETFAHVLSRAGYATAYVGKWHLAGPGKPEWQPRDAMGFTDNRYMFNRGHWKKLALTPEGPRVGTTKADGEPGYAVDGADETSFTTDWLTDRALEFINDHIKSPGEEPFCCLLSLPDPHGPNTVRKPYDTMYPLNNFAVPPGFTLDSEFRASFLKAVNPNHTGLTRESLKAIMTQYYGMVKCIDDNVGRLINRLKELGLYDNMVIIFTADHGDLCGEHHKQDKGDPFEMSARVPFVIRWPEKIPPGLKTDKVMSMIDFKPTLLGLLGFEGKRKSQGQDGSFLLTGEEGKWRNTAFMRGQTDWICAVDDRYKLIIPVEEEQGGPVLLDRRDDPLEKTNCLSRQKGDSAVGETAREMAIKLKEYCLEFNDPHYKSDHTRRLIEKLSQKPADSSLKDDNPTRKDS